MKQFTIVALVLLLTWSWSACQPQPSPERQQAEELTAEGLDLLAHRRPSDERSYWMQAAALFEQALEADSTYALAYASLVVPYASLEWEDGMARQEVEPRVRAVAAKALTLDPDLPDALVGDAIVKWTYDGDAAGTEAALRRAIELDPEHVEAHRELGHLFNRTGRSEEALLEFERALKHDSRSIRVLNAIAGMRIDKGDLDGGAEMAEAGLAVAPNDIDNIRSLARIAHLRDQASGGAGASSSRVSS